jgi:hypothetical protein
VTNLELGDGTISQGFELDGKRSMKRGPKRENPERIYNDSQQSLVMNKRDPTQD